MRRMWYGQPEADWHREAQYSVFLATYSRTTSSGPLSSRHPKKGRLRQLLILGPVRLSHFAHQPWLNPLSFLWDLRRILDRWLVDEKRLQPINLSIVSLMPISLKPAKKINASPEGVPYALTMMLPPNPSLVPILDTNSAKPCQSRPSFRLLARHLGTGKQL